MRRECQGTLLARCVSRHLAAAMVTRVSTQAILLLCLSAHVVCVYGDDVSCTRDGLYAYYETDCQQYVKCEGGVPVGRFQCPSTRVFSEAKGACVARRQDGAAACVRRGCAAADTLAYAAPGTACRHYYRCTNGTATGMACPPDNAWFDSHRQACVRGAGTCFEPLCTGLPDGDYPDASHNCRRKTSCRGGEVRAVTSCAGPCTDDCPPPRSFSIPIPAGDANFCSDEGCSSLCQHTEDGDYADRTTGCREYFVCKSHRVISRGVCDPGFIFHEGVCIPEDRARCPPPGRSPCFNKPDGLHRDWRDCSSWYDCRRERVIARGSCDSGQVFDGNACVPSGSFHCKGPQFSTECETLPSGTYQDMKSNCSEYFHCEGRLKFTLKCESGKVYDGVRCSPVSAYSCPLELGGGCSGRADGRYHAPDSGCRGYYSCFAGDKAVYACPHGTVFNGETCVSNNPGVCTKEDYTCSGLANGYHAEIESGCHRYFYCEGGDRLATFNCRGGKIFDGHSCVDPSMHQCGRRRNSIDLGRQPCETDGFFVQEGTQCQSYYFCIQGARTNQTCPSDHVFNGQVCVPKSQYTCQN